MTQQPPIDLAVLDRMNMAERARRAERVEATKGYNRNNLFEASEHFNALISLIAFDLSTPLMRAAVRVVAVIRRG